MKFSKNSPRDVNFHCSRTDCSLSCN